MPPDAVPCRRPLLVDHLQLTVEGEPRTQVSIEIPTEAMARISTVHPQKVEGQILFLDIESKGRGHEMQSRLLNEFSIDAEDMTAGHASGGLFRRLF